MFVAAEGCIEMFLNVVCRYRQQNPQSTMFKQQNLMGDYFNCLSRDGWKLKNVNFTYTEDTEVKLSLNTCPIIRAYCTKTATCYQPMRSNCKADDEDEVEDDGKYMSQSSCL